MQPSVSGDAIRFDGFQEARGQTLYWKLPVKFAGDKVTSYGGNLNYVYRCSGSGQENQNPDVILRVSIVYTYDYPNLRETTSFFITNLVNNTKTIVTTPYRCLFSSNLLRAQMDKPHLERTC
jgi:hypothetical protein